MEFFRNFLHVLTKKELRLFLYAFVILIVVAIVRGGVGIQENSELVPVQGGSFREGVVGQPILINPILSDNQVDKDLSALLFSPLSSISTYINSDEKNNTFTVSLKEGLVWDDGVSITSDDIIFSIKTIQDPDARSPISKNWAGVAVERMSQLQVRIAIPEQNVFFKNTIEKLRIVPKHIYGSIPPANMRLSLYTLEPVGNGPYSFKDFSQKKNGFITEYVMERNKYFSGKNPYIDRFVFSFYENEVSLENAFRLREIDGFGTSALIDTRPFESMKSNVISIPTTRYYAVFFNTNNENFSSDSIRNALVESISKKTIADKILFGKNEYIIKNPSLEKDEEERYNPDRARKAVEDAKRTITLNVVVPNIPYLQKTADSIKKSWEDIGVQMRITLLEPRDILENAIKTSNYDAILFGNTLENIDDLFPFWHSSQRIYPGLNISSYKNSKVDSLIEMARGESRKEKRDNIVSLINSYLTEDNPALFLYSIPYTYIVRSDIGGIATLFQQETSRLSNPMERFSHIDSWFTAQARVIK